MRCQYSFPLDRWSSFLRPGALRAGQEELMARFALEDGREGV